jgi:hypothetical protein
VKDIHTKEVNCAPLSEVICWGVLKRATHPSMRAVAQQSAAVDRRGMASQRVERSTTIRRCEKPLEDWEEGRPDQYEGG